MRHSSRRHMCDFVRKGFGGLTSGTMKLSLLLRAKILALHATTHSDTSTGKSVGKRRTSISRFLRTFCGRTSLSDRLGRGAHRKLTTRDEHMVKRLILSDECQSAAEVARQAPNLRLPAVSANTVRSALRRQGLVTKLGAAAGVACTAK